VERPPTPATDRDAAGPEPLPDPGQPPIVAAAPPAAWRRWLLALVEHGQRALAALGLVLAAGLLLSLGALLAFAKLANEVAERSTAAFDLLVLRTLRQQATATLDALASALSWLGAEGLAIVVVLTVLLLAWQRRLGAIVALLLVVVGAQLLNS